MVDEIVEGFGEERFRERGIAAIAPLSSQEMKRRVPVAVLQVDICTVFDESMDGDIAAVEGAGHVERRGA